MIITVATQNLSNALKAAAPAVAGKSTLPVLGMFQIKTDDRVENIVISATNLEIGISCTFPPLNIEGETVGICIPARLFSDMVGSFGNGQTVLEITDKDLRLTNETTTARLNGYPENEFPPMAKPHHTGLYFDGEAFKRLVERVAFAASTDEARPVLQGVQIRYMDGYGGPVTLAATDGFRIAISNGAAGGEVKAEAKILTAIIPARAFGLAAKMAGNQGVYLNFDKGQAHFVGDGWMLTSQLIDGNFPDYKVLLPKSFKTKVTAQSAALLSAVRRAEIIARNGNGVVKLEWMETKIKVSATSEETGQNETLIDADINLDSKPGVIAFNVRYLAEIIEAAQGKEIVMEVNDGKSPAKFTAKDDATWQAIAMPMHLG